MKIADQITDWGGFEQFIEKLHQTGNVSVERNVVLRGVSGATRQIDVLIRHKEALYEHLIIAECKYWKRNVKRETVDVVARTVQEVRASRGVIFSTKGFQTGAVRQAKSDNIDLFYVRDLTDTEWGAPGRIVDVYLQMIQRTIGEIRAERASRVSNFFNPSPIELNFEAGLGGFTSCTATLKRDGSSGGKPLEEYITEAAKEAESQFFPKLGLINGGEQCTRYVALPINLNPDVPFQIPLNGDIIFVPHFSFLWGLEIAQSRVTVDRAANLAFACAVENLVNGKVTAASRTNDGAITQLSEIKAPDQPEDGDGVYVNGSILRVMTEGFFPLEEMAHLKPVPLETLRLSPIQP